MALGATLHRFSLLLSDVDRGVYETLDLRLARHPSETAGFMLVRLLAYALEYRDGIGFTEGIAAVDEPAVLVRDPTGQITHWIEVGAPDPERLHRGSKRAAHCAVYATGDPAALMEQLARRPPHRASEIPIHAFSRGFVTAAASALQRRSALVLTRSEGQLYLTVDDSSFEGVLREHRLPA